MLQQPEKLERYLEMKRERGKEVSPSELEFERDKPLELIANKVISKRAQDEGIPQPGQDPYKQQQIQKRLPAKEVILFDAQTGKQIWVTTSARIIVRKILNLQKVRNVYLNQAIANMFDKAKPKYSWRVNLKSLQEGEVGHIRYGRGIRGLTWKMVAVEKKNRIAIIGLKVI
jgi:hypothetical protein